MTTLTVVFEIHDVREFESCALQILNSFSTKEMMKGANVAAISYGDRINTETKTAANNKQTATQKMN
jgi:hypothetical protein